MHGDLSDLTTARSYMIASMPDYPRKEIRVRVVALLINSNRILAVQHTTLDDRWWCFPGGGQEVGENQSQTIVRELKEELNLRVVPKRLLYIAEFMMQDNQAAEFYWLCECDDNRYEIPKQERSVTDASWTSLEKLQDRDILPELVKDRIACDYPEFPACPEYLGTHGPTASQE
jgi:8-oxo-dGTP diphosphatase